MSQYGTTTNMASLGLPSKATANVSPTVQNAHLTAQASRIDTYLRGRHTLPLSEPYPDCIVEANCVMAAYSILTNYRGYGPADLDTNFRLRYEDQLAFLQDLAAGRASLADDADATPDTNEGRPRVQTGGSNRAWGTGDTGESRGW